MVVSFPWRGATLRGQLSRPAGRGRLPAIIWNHGSERDPGPLEELARFYNSLGYVFFAPYRRGHGSSPGEYPFAAIHAQVVRENPSPEVARERAIGLVIAMHEDRLEDLAAAARWLIEQPFVDRRRLAMSGASHGGIQTILAAEADFGPSAFVPFAPGAMAWAENPELRRRLLRAVRAAPAPMFLIQADNDYDLGPSRELGRVLLDKGLPNAVRVYPPYGAGAQAGHGAFALEATAIWGDGVQTFLGQTLGTG